MDVKWDFLNGYLTEDIYMQQPYDDNTFFSLLYKCAFDINLIKGFNIGLSPYNDFFKMQTKYGLETNH